MTQRAIVLRWSGDGTIQAHVDLIDELGFVWWGWWKKEWEPFDVSILAHASTLARRQSLRIGLVNRKEGLYCAATCTEVAFDERGRRIGCPDPIAAPNYYNTEACGAWFRLTDIQSLEPAQYVAEFGQPPTGDPTLYEVRGRRGGLEVLPRPTWDTTPTPTNGTSILHLSDVMLSPESDVELAVDRIADRCEELQSAPGAIVVAGGLIEKGDATQWTTAESFLDSLCSALHLTRRHVVIVPGNHDFLAIAPSERPFLDYRHERGFRMFLEAFYDSELRDLERVQRVKSSAGWDWSFVALNSTRLPEARRDGGRDAFRFGYIGAHRYREMLEYISSIVPTRGRGSEKLIVPIMHHALLPIAGASLEDCVVDAAEVLDDLLRLGVRLVLHGRVAEPSVAFVSSTLRSARLGYEPPREPIWFAASGHAMALASAGKPRGPVATFNVYEPRDDGLGVRVQGIGANGNVIDLLDQEYHIPLS